MLGCVVVGYIIGKLHAKWNYYKKTGVFIEDVKDEFKELMRPLIDMLIKEIYPYIFLSIIFVFISFLLILGIFILLLRNKILIPRKG